MQYEIDDPLLNALYEFYSQFDGAEEFYVGDIQETILRFGYDGKLIEMHDYYFKFHGAEEFYVGDIKETIARFDGQKIQKWGEE